MQAREQRRHRGAVSYFAGLSAEASVARHYEDTGRTICARRWRGNAGEIDLVAQEGQVIVFIEVKQSRTHALAAEHLTKRQMERIYASASEFLSHEPSGQLTEVRFDVALVDNIGKIEIVEQAFAA
jgi:putative endonuclease